jgi:hypothetical protein
MNALRANPRSSIMTAARSSTLRRTLAVAAGALALACGAAQAAPHGGGWHGGGGGWHGGGYHGGYHGGAHWGYRSGWGWGWWDPLWPIGVGLGIGLATAPAYYYDSPDYVVVNPAPVYPAPAPVYVNPPAPAAAPAPRTVDPIFYPRNGQSAAQTEADRQDCNRWATTQLNAMNDASVFQRATFACMDGRGYTVR